MFQPSRLAPMYPSRVDRSRMVGQCPGFRLPLVVPGSRRKTAFAGPNMEVRGFVSTFSKKLVGYLLCAIIGISYAHATSIVIKLQERKITIAADTLGVDAAGIVHEDQCKIVPFGKAAFSVTGISSFSPTLSPGLNWDAKSAAQAAFAAHAEDIEAAADDWEGRAERYFGGLAISDRLRARSLVEGDPDHALFAGVFVGWDSHGVAKLIFELVRFEEPDLLRTQRRSAILTSRNLPYTTNAITQQLIEGNSTRTRALNHEWRTRSKEVPSSEREWRWLEFLIEETSKLDKVGKRVDVLELNRDDHSNWLQNLTCQK